MVHHSKAGGNLTAETDTIAAIATPAGIGGIGVIRISGSQSPDFARQITATEPVARQALFRPFLDADNGVIDEGIVLYFPAPASYTGEDVCEFQCHGSPVVLNLLLSRLLDLGARLAQPGEYTRRAFLNGRIDLAQAEAVVDLINSSTESAARSAVRSLKGEFSDRVNTIIQEIVDLRIFIEAAIDFPEEEIDFLADNQIQQSISQINDQLTALIAQSSAGCLLREGITAVIAGRPNAGKSSLFNRLAGQNRAIVTAQAGTTRDTVDVVIDVSGLAVRLIDTAGIREIRDEVEHEGILRTRDAIENADIVLYVIDSECGYHEQDLQEVNDLDRDRSAILWNKTDLTGTIDTPQSRDGIEQVQVSALTGSGIENTYKIIKRVAGYEVNEEGVFLARRRHLAAIQGAADFVARAQAALAGQSAGELAAQDLRDAMESLGQIAGTPSADELLGEIFANFCIGK